MKDKGCRVRAAAEPGATRNGTSCRKDRHGYARRVPQTPHASLQKTQSAAVKDAGPESVRLVTGNSTPTNKQELTGDKAAARSKNVDRDVPTSCRHLQHTTSILLYSMLLHPAAVEKLKILALDLERCKRAATPYMLSVSEPLPDCDKTSQLTDVEDCFFARDRSSTCCACSWACTKSTINPLTYLPYLSQTALSTEACAFATTFSERA